MEVWNGRLADYENLRVYGALAFSHVKKDKLEAWTKKCIFIGYIKGVKWYNLWRLDSGETMFFVSREITDLNGYDIQRSRQMEGENPCRGGAF